MSGIQLYARERRHWLAFLVAAGLLCLAVSGCASSYAKRLDSIRRDFYENGDAALAKENVEKNLRRASKKEVDTLTLDAASLDLASGDVVEAKRKLVKVRDRFDDLERQAARKTGENVLQYWTDDSIVSYEGEDYEKIMIRVCLAIADLLDEGEDARAYAKQIVAKQDEIVQNGSFDDPNEEGKKVNPKRAYPRIPLGPYIEGLLCEETYLDTAQAALRYRQVEQWRPQFKQIKEDLVRAQTSVHSQPGSGRLYVFAFVGRGPRKEQIYAEATQFALLVADQIFSATSRYSVPPTIAPVPIPALVVEEPGFDSVGLDVDGNDVGATETLADVNEMAIKQYEATKDKLIARAVVRRVVKKGAIYALKEAGRVNSWASLAANVGGIAWEATETADTRCWGLLPAKIQVLNVELPVGEHRLTFYPRDRKGERVGESVSATIRINANRNTYALVTYPDRRPIAPVVSSSDRDDLQSR